MADEFIELHPVIKTSHDGVPYVDLEDQHGRTIKGVVASKMETEPVGKQHNTFVTLRVRAARSKQK